MSSYTGLCVTKLSTGEIVGVQVVDTAGNELNIEPQEYIRRGINPPLASLPSCSERKS